MTSSCLCVCFPAFCIYVCRYFFLFVFISRILALFLYVCLFYGFIIYIFMSFFRPFFIYFHLCMSSLKNSLVPYVSFLIPLVRGSFLSVFMLLRVVLSFFRSNLPHPPPPPEPPIVHSLTSSTPATSPPPPQGKTSAKETTAKTNRVPVGEPRLSTENRRA